jgi:site-specific DNA recombinase
LHILKSATYVGAWSYDPSTGKSIAVEVPAIISQELYDLAQQQREANRITARRNVKREYLLRSRLTCGGCGYRMIGKATPALLKSGERRWHYYYECRARRRKDLARTCTARAVRASDLDDAVWHAVVDLFSDPGKLRDAYAVAQAESESGAEPLRQQIEALDAEIARMEARRERLLEVYLDGGATATLYRKRRDETEERLTDLLRDRGRVVNQLNSFNEGTVFESLDEFAALVRDEVASVEDFQERRWYVDTLDIQGVVGLKHEDGTRCVEIRAHGVHLATILV